jgi:hypothetical protein
MIEDRLSLQRKTHETIVVIGNSQQKNIVVRHVVTIHVYEAISKSNVGPTSSTIAFCLSSIVVAR